MTRTDRTIAEGFVAVLCADADLLRAEFDAIVDANWDASPPVPPARSGGPGRRPAPARPPRRSRRPAPAHRPGARGPVRERSPPGRTVRPRT